MLDVPLTNCSRSRGSDPVDAVCDYLIADRGHTRVLITCMDEEDVRTILAHPDALVEFVLMAHRWHHTALRGKASHTHASTAPLPASWDAMCATWGSSPYRKRCIK